MERLKMLTQQNPLDPFLRYALGLEWEKHAHWQKAEQIWRDLLLKHPNYLPALHRLAELLFAQQKFTEAHAFASDALRCAESEADEHAKQVAHGLLAQIEEEMNLE